MNICYINMFGNIGSTLLFQEVVGESFFNFDLVGYIILVLSVCLNIFLMFYERKKKDRHHSSSRKSETDYKYWYDIEKQNVNKLISENERLKNKLDSLYAQTTSDYIKEKEPTIQTKYESSPISDSLNEQQDEEKAEIFEFEIKEPQQIFLPSPFEDCRFSIEDVSYEQTSSSLYRVNLENSHLKGSLTILQNADFTRALNSPDHYLEKACIYENAFNPNASQLQVVEKGKVKLEDKDWVVTEKIKIKFV